MLLTRTPLYSRGCPAFSFDLHVLSAPPALILSRDQTLIETFELYRSAVYSENSDDSYLVASNQIVKDLHIRPRTSLSGSPHRCGPRNLLERARVDYNLSAARQTLGFKSDLKRSFLCRFFQSNKPGLGPQVFSFAFFADWLAPEELRLANGTFQKQAFRNSYFYQSAASPYRAGSAALSGSVLLPCFD